MKKTLLLSLICYSSMHIGTACATEAPVNIWNLDIEELMEIKVDQLASLTQTNSRITPASVTTINAGQIKRSSARSLDELLEIYVPGLQSINHHWGFSHLGARGIMSDRDDKYLLLVNGRTMNDRTVVGAVTERDLVMLGDIHHIDVIRGPGTATYGVGAVSMVINITTFDNTTFQGHETTTRIGAGEDYLSQEYKYGSGNQGDKPAYFVYLGISDFKGATSTNAPLRYSRNMTFDGESHAAETDINAAVGRDKAQYRDHSKVKLHTSLRKNDLLLSARFTRGGEEKSYPINSGGIVGLGSQQAMLSANYKHVLNNAWHMMYDISFDSLDYERNMHGSNIIQSYREDELLTRAVAHWEPEDTNSLAIGIEANREKFGMDSPGFPHDDVEIPGLPKNSPTWYTTTASLFYEHQWNISPKLTLFDGARLDKNTYTKPLLSPRLALVFSPGNNDTLKSILSRSQRMNFAVDMHKENLASGTHSTEPETLDSLELTWNHQYGNGISSAIALYKEHLDLIGFPAGPPNQIQPDQQKVVAKEKQSGIEIELFWNTDTTQLGFSHTYTHLDDIRLLNGVTSTFVSTEPEGFGHSLNNWSNHLSKLQAAYQYNHDLLMHGSLVYYWKFDGIRDDMKRTQNVDPINFNYGNNDEAYGSNIYLNLGVEYTPLKDLSINITGHNLLGLIDKSYNKRNYFAEFGDNYRLQSAALDVSFTLLF